MFSSSIGRLRTVGLLEGVSFVLLLTVAMPLKYAAGMPMAVKIAGWIHGGLFMLLLITLLNVMVEKRLAHRPRRHRVLRSADAAGAVPDRPLVEAI